MILCIETSTAICSVALCDSNRIIAMKENTESKSHASLLTVFIGDIFKSENISARDLEAVAVSKGPGSYTGLRIGVSAAKGIAYAASLPLIGIDTTLSMFYGLPDNIIESHGVDNKSLFVPMLDARRMEVYYAIYRNDGTMVKNISAEIISENSFADIPESVRLVIFGDGSSKCKPVLQRKNTVFADEFRISAAFMQKPAYEHFRSGRFEDVAYFEPFYLKDFIATVPRKNIPGR